MGLISVKLMQHCNYYIWSKWLKSFIRKVSAIHCGHSCIGDMYSAERTYTSFQASSTPISKWPRFKNTASVPLVSSAADYLKTVQVCYNQAPKLQY
jgi:hypothetical protein